MYGIAFAFLAARASCLQPNRPPSRALPDAFELAAVAVRAEANRSRRRRGARTARSRRRMDPDVAFRRAPEREKRTRQNPQAEALKDQYAGGLSRRVAAERSAAVEAADALDSAREKNETQFLRAPAERSGRTRAGSTRRPSSSRSRPRCPSPRPRAYRRTRRRSRRRWRGATARSRRSSERRSSRRWRWLTVPTRRSATSWSLRPY